MKYRLWLKQWLLSTIRPLKKMRTYQKYNDIAQQLLIPSLGEYEMEMLTGEVIQNWIAHLTDKYAANTINGIITVLKSSLQSAEKLGMVLKQHTDEIQYPKKREKQIECFSPLEQQQIEKYTLTSKKYKLYGIVLCLYSGLRIGELLALQWADVDLSKGWMTITKTCHDYWEDGKYIKIIESPKTELSQRLIPLPKTLIPYLKEMKKHLRGNYVLSSPSGKEISIRSYQRTFELLLKRLKISHKGFHSLRHTFATRAIESGMDVKTLSEILGHKNSSITLNRYVHTSLERKCLMINKLGKILS